MFTARVQTGTQAFIVTCRGAMFINQGASQGLRGGWCEGGGGCGRKIELVARRVLRRWSLGVSNWVRYASTVFVHQVKHHRLVESYPVEFRYVAGFRVCGCASGLYLVRYFSFRCFVVFSSYLLPPRCVLHVLQNRLLLAAGLVTNFPADQLPSSS